MAKYEPEGRRPLRPEEKRENDPDRWTQLIQYMDAVIIQANDIRSFAVERRAEVEEGKQW